MDQGGFNSAGKYNFLEQTTVEFVAPAATETEELTDRVRVAKITTPASGVGNVKLPHADEVAGRIIVLDCIVAGGGEVKVVNQAGTDEVGDNLSAAGDKVILYSDGAAYEVLLDRTT